MNILTEYLVALGFTVNNSAYQQFNSALRDAELAVASTTTGMVKSFGAVTAAIGLTFAATGGLLAHLSSLDMGYQKFALRMYMTNQNAKELKTTLDALGESLEDAAFVPELRGQFNALLTQRRAMSPPDEYAQQMKNLREIGFEFKRMRLEASVSLEWIGFYLFKHLEEPLRSVKESLKYFNDYVTKNMPAWTAKIASGLASLVNVGRSVAWLFNNIGETLSSIWDSFPKGVKQLSMALAAMSVVLLTSPMGQFLYMITSALILLEDFYGYMNGWKSSSTLAPMWKWLVDFFDKMNKSVEFKGFKDAFKGLTDSVDDLVQSMKALFGEFKQLEGLKSANWGTFLSSTFRDWLNSLRMVLEAFKFIAEIITHAARGTLGEYLERKLIDIQNYFNRTNPYGPRPEHPGGSRVLPSEASPGGSGGWRDAGGSPRGGSSTRGKTTESAEIDDFMEALAQKEGNGRYDQPPHDDEGFWNLGGRYQILEDNWPNWAQEAGLGANAPYSAENQERVARFKVMQYYRDNGNRWDLVAAAWNGGGGGVTSYRKYGSESYMAGYVGDVMNNLKSIRSSKPAGGNTAASGAYSNPATGGSFAMSGGSEVSQTNFINVTVPPGSSPEQYANALSQAVGPYMGPFQRIRIVHQMRDLSGVGA